MYGFESVIGHEALVAQMRQNIAAGRVGHAYILSGEKGIGKKTLAKAFAKALQCEALTPGANVTDACGVCLSCRVFESGNHPDVLYVTGTKTKSIGVDDVREQIIRPMSVKPFRYRYKIFMVDEAETLTPAAQNALLKTIEEPASYGIFFFLAAHTHAFLPTVLSRCVPLMLNPLPDTQVLAALSAADVPEDTARFCAAFARGNIGHALSLAASEDFKSMRSFALDVVKQVRQTDVAGTFALYRGFEKWKESIQPLLDMLYLCYRDLIVYKGTGDANRLAQRDTHEPLMQTADETPVAALFQGVDAITRTKRILRQNGNFQLAVEMLLLTLNGAYSELNSLNK